VTAHGGLGEHGHMSWELRAHDVILHVDDGLRVTFTGWAELSHWHVEVTTMSGISSVDLSQWVTIPDVTGPMGQGVDLLAGAAALAGPAVAGLRVHIPHAGNAVFVTPVVRGPGRLLRMRMVADLNLGDIEGALATWLHEGYQSWDYAGVHPLPPAAREEPQGVDAHRSFWRALITSDHRCLGAAALTARSFVTSFRCRLPGQDGLFLDIEQAGAPLGAPAISSFRQGRPENLDLVLPDGTVMGETVAIMTGPDPLDLAEDLADLSGAASQTRHWEGEPLRGWESWYYYGPTISPEAHLANTRMMRERLSGVAFVQAQIDDGWQRANGSWEPRGAFAAMGMAELARRITDMGAVPGLWVAPFMVDAGSPLHREKPEWLIRDSSGAPLTHISQRDRLALDASNSDVVSFLEELGGRIAGWGYRFVKADFLFLGALEGQRFASSVTGTGAMRAGLEALCRGLGSDVFILGCGMPLLPGVGLVHAARIGGDIGVPNTRSKDGRGHGGDRGGDHGGDHGGDPLDDVGPPIIGFFTYRCAARNAAARACLHRRHFLADPDVLMLEGLTLPQCRSVLTMGALCGGPYLLADKLAHLDADRWELAQHPALAHLVEGPGFRPVDLFARPDPDSDDRFLSHGRHEPRIWVQHRFDGTAVALFNWDDEPWEATASWDLLGVAPGIGWSATDLWKGDPISGSEPGLACTVDPHDVVLIWIGTGRGPS
jgi:alpha galactosidase C-like protein/melibiase-like protein